jgi:proliferating cell nuclear antigen
MSTTIFKAKTGEAYYIKVLAELLSNNLKTGCFEINEEGIFLRQMDSQRKTLIDLELLFDSFSVYKFKGEEEEYLGINLSHFHKMLKSIKKKDSLQLLIHSDQPNDLAIETIPKENTRKTTSYIKIQKTQNLDIEMPTGYGKPVIVPSTEFQKTMKDLLNIGSSVRVEAKGFQIRFTSDADDILKRCVEFGEAPDADDSDSEDTTPDYNQTFATDQLSRVAKIAGLSNTIQIFPGHPLLFRSSVGSLGKISIYIKSNEESENEKNIDDEDNEDENN